MTNHKLPLRTQILVRTAPIAVLLWILVSLYPAAEINGQLQKQIQSQLDAETTYLRHIVDDRLATSIAACEAIAQNDVIVNAIIDIEHRETTLRSFLRSVRMPDANAKNVVMTDFRGHPIASMKTIEQPETYANQSWMNSLLEGQPIIRIDGNTLTIAQPVIYGNSPEAAIVITYNMAEYTRDVGIGTETSISKIIYKQETVSQIGGSLSTEMDPTNAEGWIRQSLPVSLIPGLRVSVAKSDQVVQRAMQVVQRAMVLETAGALAVLIWGIWFATSLVTNSVNKLVKVIDDVSSNTNLDRRVDAGASAEFARLGSHFNAMLSEIQNTTVTKEKYRIPALVARYTHSSVVVTSADGKIEWINEAFTRMTGYRQDEVIGRSPGSFLQGPATDLATVHRIRTAIRNRRGVNVDLLNYNKAGEEFWVAIEIRPICSASGEVENYIAVQNDITAQVQAEAEKDALNQKLFDLSRQAGMAEVASGVLHNVGNAVNSVNVSASLLKTQIANSASSSISRIAGLIGENKHQLLEFFSSNAGRNFPAYIGALAERVEHENQRNSAELNNVIKSVDHIKHIVSTQQRNAGCRVIEEQLCLSELLEESLRIRNKLITDHAVRVTQSLTCVPDIVADRHMVVEILVNLIGNAVNAVEDNSDGGRDVSISILAEDNESVSCVIADNGVGISVENLEKIFSHGFTTRDAGNGFGLHSSILAAKTLAGSITAKSDGIGQGATFTLRLPASTNSSDFSEPADTTVHQPKFQSMPVASS